MPAMRIDYVHLLDKEIKHYTNLDETVEVCYPTGCVDMTKKEILTKMCEVEFKMTATWTHEFLEDLEGKWHKLSTGGAGEDPGRPAPGNLSTGTKTYITAFSAN